MTDITMPRLSDSMEDGTILTWLKHDGETVAQGEGLVEIETDKATMTYESPVGGVVTIVAREGSAHPIGAVIATVGDAAGAYDRTEPPAARTGEAGPPLVEASAHASARVAGPAAPPGGPASPNGDGAARATPVARRLATLHGVDLARLQGTGPRGRVTRVDVAASAGITLTPRAPSPAPAPAAREPAAPAPAAVAASRGDAAGARGQVTMQEPTRLERVVARRMAETKATVPDFQVSTDVRMNAALQLRAKLKQAAPEVVPSVNDLIVKASALSLREWPRANGSYKDGRFELYSRVNVGIAVAGQGALVVPTITDADMRSLGSIAAESQRLAERVRDGTVRPSELSGGTFTVSNLGMYGMTHITSVIYSPQAAILGVGASRPIPAIVDGELVERQLMTLTLSCDHRILHGADAAQLLDLIRVLLEEPLRLVL